MLSVVEPAALWLFALAVPILFFMWLGWADLRRRLGRWRVWALLIVRLGLLMALVLAMAGLQIGRPVWATATVFLIDASDSIAPVQRTAILDYLAQAQANADPDDRMAVVVFGARAAVERIAEPPYPLTRIGTPVLSSRTNIADAIELGLALLPAAMHQRLVLLSDGGANEGDTLAAARLAAARGVPIEVVPLVIERAADALITAFVAPKMAQAEQTIPLTVTIESAVSGAATVQLLVDGQLQTEVPLDLVIGDNQLTITAPAGEPGFRQFEVRLIAPFDTQPANNRAVAFTFVSGPPRLLLLTTTPDQVSALVAAWQATGITVVVQEPSQVPADPHALRAFDTIALVDTPADKVPTALQHALTTYVRDNGGGLLVIGGPRSFGAGGWRRTLLEPILPVALDPPLREERPDLALVLVIDRSGSMRELVDDARTQLDLAREAVYQASRGLTQRDQIALIAFDSIADTLLPLQPLPGLFTIEDALSRLVAGGGTNIRSGIALAAETIATSQARIRHVILLTDGVSETEYADLVADLRAQGITVSAIAIGRDTDPALERVAQIGGGKYYLVQRVPDLPQVVLEETVRVANRDVIEEPFRPVVALPTAWLRELGPLPLLRGRNAASARSTSRVLLVAEDGAPLLATAQVGLGRVVAWTSDLSGRWAAAWVTWSDFPRFAANLVAEALPLGSDERLAVTTTVNANRVEIEVLARDERGRPLELGELRNRVSGLAGSFELSFSQVAPDRYRAITTIDQIGAYLVQIGASDSTGQPIGNVTTAFAINFSPEYGRLAANPGLLADIAALTGGSVDPPPETVFAPTAQPVYEVRSVTIPLLWIALVLLPIDVALRRLLVPLPELSSAIGKSRSRTTAAPAPLSSPSDRPSPSLPDASDALRRPLSDEERIATLLTAKRRRRKEP